MAPSDVVEAEAEPAHLGEEGEEISLFGGRDRPPVCRQAERSDELRRAGGLGGGRRRRRLAGNRELAGRLAGRNGLDAVSTNASAVWLYESTCRSATLVGAMYPTAFGASGDQALPPSAGAVVSPSRSASMWSYSR